MISNEQALQLQTGDKLSNKQGDVFVIDQINIKEFNDHKEFYFDLTRDDGYKTFITDNDFDAMFVGVAVPPDEPITPVPLADGNEDVEDPEDVEPEADETEEPKDE